MGDVVVVRGQAVLIVWSSGIEAEVRDAITYKNHTPVKLHRDDSSQFPGRHLRPFAARCAR